MFNRNKRGQFISNFKRKAKRIGEVTLGIFFTIGLLTSVYATYMFMQGDVEVVQADFPLEFDEWVERRAEILYASPEFEKHMKHEAREVVKLKVISEVKFNEK